jgi:Sec-independent protein translocase protein TatA
MFGLSFAELIIVILVALIFIKPKDLPEIAHFVGKIFYRGKKLFEDVKQYLKGAEKDFGLDELRHELNRGIAEEKAKLEDELTVIVDVYGNEHRVPNIENLRPDLSPEELSAEVEKSNQENKASANFSSDQKPSQ